MNTISHAKKIYLRVWIALILLLALTWGAAQFDFGRFNTPVAIVISIIKMMLVLWFFMHLVEQSSSSRFAVLLAVALMAILAGLTIADVATRHTFPQRAEPMPSSGFYQR